MEWFSKPISVLEKFEFKKNSDINLENSKELFHRTIYKNFFLQDIWNI